MKHHFHFIGICGIGMSGIAKILATRAIQVSGCDQTLDPIRINQLTAIGCTINKHQGSSCQDPTITTIVRSTDIALDHPEILNAQKKNIPIKHRAEILAQLMDNKIGITIAGAHGKTTTSSLLAHCLLQAHLDPSIIVGGHMHNIDSNAHAGSGKYIVVEADESDRSFLLLPKTYSIITNIDREHLNVYTDFDDIKNSFITFANSLAPTGCHMLCLDDPAIASIIPYIKTPFLTYGTDTNADFYIHNVILNEDSSTFCIRYPDASNQTYSVALPGMHNILNATGVIGLCHILSIDQKQLKFALEAFQGVERRFTFKGISIPHGALIYDDYGHHPKELEVTFKVAAKKSKGKMVMVFQPQRFSRTKHLWNDFVTTCAQAEIDHLIITDIYPAHEKPEPNISSQNLTAAIIAQNPKAIVEYIPFDLNGISIIKRLNALLTKNDLLLFQGAGKVNTLAEMLLKK